MTMGLAVSAGGIGAGRCETSVSGTQNAPIWAW